MMEDRLSEIRDRFDAIIPGPWRWYGNTATDQVLLATTDRGRLFIMVPGVRSEERVFDHDMVEGYSLEEARERSLSWCPVHGDPEFPGDSTDRQVHCQCDEIREFLSGTMDQEEGRRDLLRGIRSWLTRHVSVKTDLRFAVRDPRSPADSWQEERKLQGGLMRSYREGMPRYEVLGETTDGSFRGYRTREEYEAQTGKKAETALYREDFVGLDQPEATFIERAPEDIGWLLDRVAELEATVAERERDEAARLERLARDPRFREPGP